MPYDMTRPVTPVAGPNYQQNKAQLQQMGFNVSRPRSAPTAPQYSGTNAGVEALRQQGFQVSAPAQPATVNPRAPAPRPGASTRPAGYAAAAGDFHQRNQQQLAANRTRYEQGGFAAYDSVSREGKEAQQLLAGLRPSMNHANKPNWAQQELVDGYLAKIAKWNPSVADRAREQWSNKAAAAEGSGAGSGYTPPGFPDPQPSPTSSKPFDRYYGYGDKETWQAHGSPKGGRPGQARPSPQPGQGTPYGTDATGQTAINDERWGRGRWAYGRPQPNAPTAQPGGDALQTIAQQAPPSMYQMPGRTFGPGADPLQQAYQQSMNAWQMPKQQLMQWGQQQQNVPWGPNYGNNFANRPDPYSLNVQGQFGNNLQDMWGGIGGFIQGVNDQAAQQRVGTYLGQGNPGAGYGKVNYNVPQLVQQGNQMVANGWQNPFM